MNIEKEVKDYLEYCRYRKELDEKTLKAYRIDLSQFIDFMLELEINKSNIEKYITNLHKKYKQKTVKRKIASVKAFYKYMEEEEILEQDNPFYKVKVKFKETVLLPRIIPRNTIEDLLNYMYRRRDEGSKKEKKYTLRNIAVVELFFATGIRVYELSNLKAEDVDLLSGVIRII